MPPDTTYTSDSDLESVLSICNSDKVKTQQTKLKYKCSICGTSFRRLDQLDAHEFRHTGIRKHACTYAGCDKTYSILTHLKRHLRNTHERVDPPQKNIKCSIDSCEKVFSSSCNMKRHVKEVHENPKVYYCSFCNDKFTQKLKLRRHEIKHTGVYPYNCDKCGKGLHQQWQYERHIAVCKIYPCVYCDEKFDKWSLLQKHCNEKQHRSKYHKCDQCSCTFKKPSELQRHIILKHLENTESTLYKCSFEGCARSYMYESNLTQHIKVTHNGNRFECKEMNCGRSFSSAQNLTKHMKNGIHGAGTKVKKKSKQKKRNYRYDKGKPVMSNLASLSGIAVDRQLNKLLRERDECAINVTAEKLFEDSVLNTLTKE